MNIALIDPAGLPKVDIYRQVAVATGSRLVFVAGQVARDAEGNKVGEGDLAAQVERVYLNLALALAEVGATFDDVVKLTLYYVADGDGVSGKLPLLAEGVSRAVARLGISPPTPPLTGIGVVELAEPDMLVEVEAVAVLD